LAASCCSRSFSLAGNSNSYVSQGSSSWEVLNGGWSLPSQGWFTTNCLPWQDSLSTDLPLHSCFSIQFLNWNCLRPTLLVVQGACSSGAAAVYLAALLSTWHKRYNSWSHDSIHRQVISHYNHAK
jgi:hypothetical protein